jgi:serine/threonine-protein kinase
MQYIDGISLNAAAKQLTLEQMVLVIRQVAEGMQAAHRLGLIHRDLKPANIMLERTEDSWRPYVVDFGLVRDMAGETLTQTAAALGTPMFMSPEQALGEHRRLDRRTDIYSLGATLYTLLAERPPYDAATPMEMMLRVVSAEPRPLRKVVPSVPADLERVVMKCLEKEPQRRYDSARDLADDLGRFLDGETVLARPATWIYRWRKRASRNRALVAVSAAAALALVAAAGYAVKLRMDARVAAQLAQRFGQEAERIDAAIRAAYLVPLHDVRPEKRAAQARLDLLAQADRESGGLARGALAYARGLVRLRFGNLDEARTDLESAQRDGPGSPELMLALGLVFARLYERELQALQTISQPELRLARRQRAEKELRDRAVEYLRSGRESGFAAPDYLAALLAHLENRREEALQKARAAGQANPTLYEAARLAGVIFLSAASEAAERGDIPTARENFEQAVRAFEAAIRIGESDPDNYLYLGIAHSEAFEMEVHDAGGNAQDHQQAGLDALTKGLAADPDDVALLSRACDLRRLEGEALMMQGRDPTAALRLAENDAHRAIQLAPREAGPYKGMAHALIRRAEWLEERGGDPRPSLHAAIEHLEQAVRLAPRDPHSLNALGFAWETLHDAEIARGSISALHADQAVATFKKAVDAAPNLSFIRTNLGNAYISRAEAEMVVGRDPEPYYRRAISEFQQALKLNPNDTYARNNLGQPYLNLGLYQFGRGRDPRPNLEAARTAYRQAAQMNPRYASPRFNEGWVNLALAELALAEGEDPSPAAAASREAFEAGVKINPGIPSVFGNLAVSEAILAEYAIEQGRSPAPALERGRQDLQRAWSINSGDSLSLRAEARLQLAAARAGSRDRLPDPARIAAADRALQTLLAANPKDVEALILLGRACLLRAERDTAVARPTGADIARGRSAQAQALAVNPKSAEAKVVDGCLMLLAARADTDPRRRTAQARAAAAAIGQAIEENRFLAREFEFYRQAAENLAAERSGRPD